jgi:hypothetical protein
MFVGAAISSSKLKPPLPAASPYVPASTAWESQWSRDHPCGLPIHSALVVASAAPPRCSE